MEFDFINPEKLKAWFKKTTGLDYDNHKPEEYNEWYHAQIKEATKDDPYQTDILQMAEWIIEDKDYPQLMKVLESYDKLAKKQFGWPDMKEHPFWGGIVVVTVRQFWTRVNNSSSYCFI